MVGKKFFIALLLALLPALVGAQGPSSAQIEANKGNLKQVNVADLTNANKSLMYRVMDGASADDCTVGSGTVQVPCYWDGTTWTAANGSGGSGDVTAVGDCASGACFNGTSGTTLTFNNAGGDATLDYDGTDFSFSKLIVSPGGTLSGGTTTLGTVAGAVDASGATSVEIPNAAAPTTDAFGEIAGDDNAWAASRGAVQFYDGTANTYLVGALSSDTPSNGQVPTWNTGGTVTWETPSSSSGITLLCKGAPSTTTTGTTEEVLATCTIPANTLSAAGHAVRVTFFMHTAANANTKRPRVRVGGLTGTLVYDFGAVAVNNQNISTASPVVITYLSSSTATANGELGRAADASAGAYAGRIAYTARAASIDWTASQNLVITSEDATTAGGTTLDTYQVELLK